MFLSANLPLTMLLLRIGSVGVTQAPIASAKRKPMCGTSAHTIRLVVNHMMHIPGPSSQVNDFHSVRKYLLGSCTPASTSCTPSTSLEKYRVMVSRSSSFPFAYCSGLMKLQACGENTKPAKVLMSASER